MIKLKASKCNFYGRDALLLFIREARHGFSQLTSLSAPRCLREQTRSSRIGTDASQFTISVF